MQGLSVLASVFLVLDVVGRVAALAVAVVIAAVVVVVVVAAGCRQTNLHCHMHASCSSTSSSGSSDDSSGIDEKYGTGECEVYAERRGPVASGISTLWLHHVPCGSAGAPEATNFDDLTVSWLSSGCVLRTFTFLVVIDILRLTLYLFGVSIAFV